MTRVRMVVPLAVTAAVFASSAAIGAPPIQPARCGPRLIAPDSAPIPPAERVSVTFQEGVVARMAEGNRPVPMIPQRAAPLSVRMVGETPNLLANPGLEEDRDGDGVPDGWSIARGSLAPEADDSVSHSGRRSIRIRSPSVATSASFQQEVTVSPETFYVLEGWIRTEGIRPVLATAVREPAGRHSPVRIEVDSVDEGGPAVHTIAAAYGYTDSSDWSLHSVGFKTGPGAHRVQVRGLLFRGSGTAWFDDLSVSALFRGDPVAVPSLSGPVPGTDLLLSMRTEDDGGSLLVDGAVSRGITDEAFQVTFTLPIDARGWQWADYARRSRTIGHGRYSYETTSSLQTTSRYPFGAIYNQQLGIGIGVPLSQPRVFRIAYDTDQGLSITFDLGVSPAAAALGPRATFSFVVFGFDPEWGFRAATKRYYELFPASFLRRTDPRCEGAWFFAPPLFALPVRQLGLGLNTVALGRASSQREETWGTRYLPFDEAAGIYASAYGHHWAYYQALPGGRIPSYHQVVSGLEAAARAGGDPAERTRAAAALRSTARDRNGRMYFERYRGYLTYYQNLDPLPSGPSWTRAVEQDQVDGAIRLARAARSPLAGIHLDSTSGMRRWGAADDYDRGHWASATLPLTFSYDSGEVVERGIFPMYGHLSRVSELAHERGMVLTANFNADEARTLGFVGADRIDYFGLEQGLSDRVTEDVSLDQFAMSKRTLAYQRPISTLDHKVGESLLSPAEVDRRLQENLFYGIFAGAFDAPVEADGRTTLAPWTAGDAPALWAKYTPILQELAAAGWEPLTFARSSNPAVWVERFGSPAGGNLTFTLHNATARDQPFGLTIDLDALEAAPPAILSAVERLTGRSVLVSSGPSMTSVASLRMTIPARSTRVIAVTAAP